jgi:hypothetical protein
MCVSGTRRATRVLTTCSSVLVNEFLWPLGASKRVEHAVDHAAFLSPEKRAGDVDIFLDRRARGHVGPGADFVGAGAKDRPHQSLDALQRPALRQRGVDGAVDGDLIFEHAADDGAKERGVGGFILIALDLLADPVRLELGEHVFEARARDLHLIEGLRRGEPGA